MHTTTPTVPSISPLTQEQLALVNDNNGLVLAVLKKTKFLARFRDDVKQAGFMGLCDAARTFDASIAKFSTHATICIQRKMWQAVEQENRRQHCSEAEIPSNGHDSEGGLESVEGKTLEDASMEAREIWMNLDKLPKNQSDAIRLRMVEDLDWREIGVRLTASRQTVLNWYNQGIETMRILAN